MSVKIYRSGQPHPSEDRAVFLYFKRVKFTLIFSPNPMFMGKVHFIKTFGSEVFLHIKCQFCMHLFTHNQLIFSLQVLFIVFLISFISISIYIIVIASDDQNIFSHINCITAPLIILHNLIRMAEGAFKYANLIFFPLLFKNPSEVLCL